MRLNPAATSAPTANRTSERVDSGSCSAREPSGRGGPSRAGSTVCAWPSPPRRGPTGASRSEGRGWALTPVPPRRDPARGPWRSTASSCQVPGTPRSSTLPRSSKPVPEPTTRSRTVRETRMSPAPAWPRMRAAMCTAIPPMSVSSSSHSPVWMPARISMPSVSASARNASAQRMACVGPSNVVRWPSPVLLHHRAAESVP